MNVQDLLNRIILLVPQFQQATAGFTRALPSLIQSLGVFALAVQAFVAAQGGWQAILTRLAQSRIGQAVGGAAQAFAQTGVGQFVGSAAGAAGRFAGAALGGAANVGGTVLASIGAAVASPLGQVALAAAGVAVAFTALGVITEKTFRTLLESQRHLAEVSPGMALTFAQSDLRRTMREMKAGEDQAGSAGFLARGLDSLADTLQPILSLLTNIANVVGGIVARIVDWIVTPISYIVEAINSFFQWIKDHWPWPWGDDEAEGKPIALSQWLDGVTAEAQRRRQPARP